MIGRAYLGFRFGSDPDPPYELVRLQVCERMGWTFQEYDETPARDILQTLELWKLEKVYAEGGENPETV